MSGDTSLTRSYQDQQYLLCSKILGETRKLEYLIPLQEKELINLPLERLDSLLTQISSLCQVLLEVKTSALVTSLNADSYTQRKV